jgi:hypothetical protein
MHTELRLKYLKTDVDKLQRIHQTARFITGDYKTREPDCTTKMLIDLKTLFSTMFCDIKSEYCLDFINLFDLVLVTKSEGEVAGTRPSMHTKYAMTYSK